MKTVFELRELRDKGINNGDPVTRSYSTSAALAALLDDLTARREAEEAEATAREAEAWRARVFSECNVDQWQHGPSSAEHPVTLTHRPTGLSAAAPTRLAALDSLIAQLAHHYGPSLSL